MIIVACKRCGTLFERKVYNQKYCTEECSKEHDLAMRNRKRDSTFNKSIKNWTKKGRKPVGDSKNKSDRQVAGSC